jgi:hypothetical protein
VLSEYVDEVVVLDSDEIEDGPVLHKSVPQGHHLHALLQGGLRVLSSLYPSFTDNLWQLGATRIAMGAMLFGISLTARLIILLAR